MAWSGFLDRDEEVGDSKAYGSRKGLLNYIADKKRSLKQYASGQVGSKGEHMRGLKATQISLLRARRALYGRQSPIALKRYKKGKSFREVHGH